MFPFSRFSGGASVGALLLVLMVFSALSVQAAAVRPPAGARSASGPTLDQCSWDRPGHDAYRGDTVAAIDRYTDIDPGTRARLKTRMARHDYDDVVTIRRDSITGKGRYGRSISDMYFGQSTVCRSVSRAGWTDAMQERGLVYCDGPQCILVPTVCRNVSRISRAGVSPEAVTGEARPLPASTDALANPSLALAPIVPDVPLTFADAAVPPGSSGGAIPGWPGSGNTDVPPGGQPGFPGGGFPGGPVVVVPGGGGGGGVLPPVAPVPEPQTWALMLAGLIGLGLSGSRRGRRSVA